MVFDESGKQLNERGETAAEEALRRSRDRVQMLQDTGGSVYVEDLTPLQQQMLQNAVGKAEESLEGALYKKYYAGGDYYDPSAVEDRKRRLDRANRMLAGTQPISQGMFQNINRDIKASIEDDFKALFEDPREANTLLRTVQSYGRDPRNWEAIMASDDPVLAARLATRQAIDAGAYDRNAPPFVQPGFDSGNYRDVQMPAEGIMGLASAVRPTRSNPNYTQYFPVTPGGRRLTQFTSYDPNLAYENQLESVQSGMARFGLDPATDAAYKDSMSYLVEGMDPSLYYGMDFDPTYDPDPRNQPQAQVAPSFSYAVGETVPDYQGTALPSSMTSVRSSGVRPVIASRPSVRREGIMSALSGGR